ncbi:MAG: hypothetical protein GY870_13790 [archaeon]|nr:hypothetical protein [archaeon]
MIKKIYTLTPSQSKALIAKGIIALPQVKDAMEKGKIFVCRGTTGAYILEELYRVTNTTPKEGLNKGDYVAGQVYIDKKFCSLGINPGPRVKEIYFEKGQPIFIEDRIQVVSRFQKGDIVLKGGNALDPNGIVGVFAGDVKQGGTIGTIMGCVYTRGVELIIPIGLEKMVYTTIEEISQSIGANNILKPLEGMKIGMIPMVGNVFTEMEALEQLFMVDTMHVGSGGVGGAEGSVSILVETEFEEEITKIDELFSNLAELPKFKENRK